MKCPFFIRKTGGYYYGWKCELYHNGNFTLHTSNGKTIDYYDENTLDKELRDKFVNEKCKSNCLGCSLYKTHHK